MHEQIIFYVFLDFELAPLWNVKLEIVETRCDVFIPGNTDIYRATVIRVTAAAECTVLEYELVIKFFGHNIHYIWKHACVRRVFVGHVVRAIRDVCGNDFVEFVNIVIRFAVIFDAFNVSLDDRTASRITTTRIIPVIDIHRSLSVSVVSHGGTYIIDGVTPT